MAELSTLGSVIKTAYEAQPNAFTDAKDTKLAGIEIAATADQTAAEIAAAYQTQVPLISQAAAEAGTATGIESWSALRVAQAIAALAGGGGAFTADVNAQITPSTAIVLDQATGNEIALDLSFTVNKAAGNYTGIKAYATETAAPGTDDRLLDLGVGVTRKASIDNAGRLLLPQLNQPLTPTIAFGDGDTGFFETTDDTISVSIAGGEKWVFNSTEFRIAAITGPALLFEGAAATNPTLIPRNDDTDTGIGWSAADQLSLIAGGVEGIRLSENVGVLQTLQTNVGLTADSGSAQGGTPLTSSYNVIATVATTGDSVTLPTAAAGQKVTIINNGANAADVFPASGDNLGSGADTAASLAAGSNITYFAIDATNWEVI